MTHLNNTQKERDLNAILKDQMKDFKIPANDLRNHPDILALAKAAQEQNEANKRKTFKNKF